MSMNVLGLGPRGARRLCLSGAVLLAPSLVTAGSGAQSSESVGSYRLRWVREGGAESCASGAALSRLLDEVLGQQGRASQPTLLLEGVARTAPPPLRYAVQVTVRDASSHEIVGERELTTADAQCGALTPALLLVLAMSVDPNVGVGGLPRAVTDELERSREEDVDVWPRTEPSAVTRLPRVSMEARDVPPPPPAADAAAPKPPESPEPLPVFGAVAASSAILPSLAIGAGLGAHLPLRRGWLLSLMLLGWYPQTVTLPDSAFLEGGGVEVAAGQLSAGLCRALWGNRLQLRSCAGFGAGLRWVKAQALLNEDNPTRRFFGPEVLLELSFRPSPAWFLASGIAGQAQLVRDRFVYRNHLGTPVPWFDPAWISARAWLSVGVFL